MVDQQDVIENRQAKSISIRSDIKAGSSAGSFEIGPKAAMLIERGGGTYGYGSVDSEFGTDPLEVANDLDEITQLKARLRSHERLENEREKFDDSPYLTSRWREMVLELMIQNRFLDIRYEREQRENRKKLELASRRKADDDGLIDELSIEVQSLRTDKERDSCSIQDLRNQLESYLSSREKSKTQTESDSYLIRDLQNRIGSDSCLIEEFRNQIGSDSFLIQDFRDQLESDLKKREESRKHIEADNTLIQELKDQIISDLKIQQDLNDHLQSNSMLNSKLVEELVGVKSELRKIQDSNNVQLVWESC